MTYRERPSCVPGAFVWTSTPDGTPQRILPDGCMDLIWMDDEVVIAGPDTQAYVHTGPAGSTLTGLRFAPGYAPAVLGAPAHLFVNGRVPLDAVWPRAKVQALVDRIARTDRIASVLEDVARLEYSARPDEAAVIATIVRDARRGRSVARIADDIGISARHLQRTSTHAFGYGPKLLARILRMMRALDLARTGTPFADVAAIAGYADQAHLSRDVRAFTGSTLRQLVPVSSGANRSTALPSGSSTVA